MAPTEAQALVSLGTAAEPVVPTPALELAELRLVSSPLENFTLGALRIAKGRETERFRLQSTETMVDVAQW